MLSPAHLARHVIRPTLARLGMGGPEAEALLLGTAIQESRLTWLAQLGRGPARGLWQMEPRTHHDIHINWLMHRPEDKALVMGLLPRRVMSLEQMADELYGNLPYACAMARHHYRRVPEALPAADDIEGQAAYWKRFYNTALGRGTVDEYVEAWHGVMAGEQVA